jgi:NADPH:quinone reductase-like Zn-dependent oxidoreductase
MKAMVCTKYGPPEELEWQEVETPTPGEDEVLVRVHASSVNFGDRALVKGQPFLIRLMGYGLLTPKNRIVGTDIAGRVEAVGGNVRQFRAGDAVYADVGECGFGAYAEYVAVPEQALTVKPANVTFEEAAAVPQASVVALQGLRDKGGIQSGQKVLINGASGGVGTFAVQIAKSFGTEVTGVCSGRNLDLVRSIGADEVIDYAQKDFTQNGERYDLIFDIVANRSVSDYTRALKPGGSYVACAFNPTALFLGPLISRREGKNVSALSHKPKVEDLAFMTELLEAGQVKPVINRCYPLRELPEAMRYLEDGRAHGKVVITVAQDGGA